jgi:hypothetical protein
MSLLWRNLKMNARRLLPELSWTYKGGACSRFGDNVSQHFKVFDRNRYYFISKSSAKRILKAKELVTIPAFILLYASEEFKNKTHFVYKRWQTDLTYFIVFGSVCIA